MIRSPLQYLLQRTDYTLFTLVDTEAHRGYVVVSAFYFDLSAHQGERCNQYYACPSVLPQLRKKAGTHFYNWLTGVPTVGYKQSTIPLGRIVGEWKILNMQVTYE